MPSFLAAALRRLVLEGIRRCASKIGRIAAAKFVDRQSAKNLLSRLLLIFGAPKREHIG
jgi:hypothetical protein